MLVKEGIGDGGGDRDDRGASDDRINVNNGGVGDDGVLVVLVVVGMLVVEVLVVVGMLVVEVLVVLGMLW